MKFNLDCVRDLLLTLEDELQFGRDLEFPTLSFHRVCLAPRMVGYPKSDIAYTTQKLKEAGYIEVHILAADSNFIDALYSAITFEGHQYLDNVRDKNVWEKIKKKIQPFGTSVALPIVVSVSQAIVKASLGL